MVERQQCEVNQSSMVERQTETETDRYRDRQRQRGSGLPFTTSYDAM